MPVSLCGAGFLFSWSFLFFFFSQPASSSLEFYLVNDFSYLISIIFASAMVVIWAKKIKKRGCYLLLANGACTFLFIGTALYFVHDFLGTGAFPALLVSRVCAGLGQGVFWIMWGELLTFFDIEDIETAFLVWLPILVVIFLFVIALKYIFTLSDSTLFLLLFLLPIASLVSFHAAFKKILHTSPLENNDRGNVALGQQFGAGGYKALRPKPYVDAMSKVKRARNKDLFKGFVNLVCVFAIISFVWKAFTEEHALDFEVLVFIFSLGAIGAFLIMWYSLKTTHRFSLSTLHRWLLPVFVLGIVSSLLAQNNTVILMAYFCLIVTNLGFELMAKLFFVNHAQKNPNYSLQIISIEFTVATIGSAVAYFFWFYNAMVLSFEISSLMLIALFLFVLIASTTIDKEPSVRGPLPDGNTQSVAVDSLEEKLLKKSQKIAEEYHLTSREHEILLLLVEGRSRTYIRETLYISKGTVDSHIHNMYTKMGIRSRDTLVNMVRDEKTS